MSKVFRIFKVVKKKLCKKESWKKIFGTSTKYPFQIYIAQITQPAFTCSKSTMESPEECVKPVQS